MATGANVNILRVEGAAQEGIHYLRAFGNSDRIREAAEAAERVVLIGGSYIGCEVAASLTAKGTDCAIVMMEEVALSRTFGEEVGRFFHELLESKGVEIHGGETLEAFEGDGDVKAVVTESGKVVEGDCVVVGAGVKPDVMLAQKAGLEIDNGITCDATLQSSVEGIYAAGDVCYYDSIIHGRRLRIEHWDVAMQQGQHVARAMLGDDSPYEVVPYFFSDLADWAGLEYVGPAEDWDEVIWRGDRDSGEFVVFYLKDGKVAGALSRRALGGPRPRADAAGGGRRRRRRRGEGAARGPRQRSGPSSHQARLSGSLAGWCNWQHVRLWSANSGFKSLARS